MHIQSTRVERWEHGIIINKDEGTFIPRRILVTGRRAKEGDRNKVQSKSLKEWTHECTDTAARFFITESCWSDNT